MTQLHALRYFTALILYVRRNEAFYAGRQKKTPNYALAFGLRPHPPEFFDIVSDTFEKSWNPTAHRAEGVIAYQMQRFTKAGV